MWRPLLLLFLAVLTVSVQAAGPFSLDKLAPQEPPTQPTGAAYWQQQQQLVEQQIDEQQLLLDQFAQRQQQLRQQLQQPLSSAIDPQQDLSQQNSLAHNQLQQLKASNDNLNAQLVEVRKRLAELPDAQQQALKQYQLAKQGEGADAVLRQHYYTLVGNALELEQQALPKQIQLLQLQQRLVQSQQADLELRLSNLNNAMAAARRAQSRAAITANHSHSNDATLSHLSEQNAQYARALAETNSQLERINQQLIRLEQRHQSLSLEYQDTLEQLNWGTEGDQLGRALLQRLQRLQQQSPAVDVNNAANQARLNRYDFEVERERLQRQRQQTTPSSQHPLLERQYQLLEQLLQANEQLISDANRLKLQQGQFASLSQRYQNLITENLLWLANAPAVSDELLPQLWFSLQWLFSGQRWQQLHDAYVQDQFYWGLWLMLTVLLLVVVDLSRNAVREQRQQHARFVGNVTQDRFSASLKALVMAVLLSGVFVLPLWCAGLILYLGDQNSFAEAVGLSLLGLALVAHFYSLIYQLSNPQGLLVAHFRRNPPLVARSLTYLTKVHLYAAPLVALLALTQGDLPTEVRDSLGRVVFILLCLLLLSIYRQLVTLAEEYHRFHSHRGSNRRLLERLVWQLLSVIPVVAIVLALQGYYYAAQQLMGQAQITITVAAGYLLIYLMIKRRILIERRRLQLAQARAKRAELLAQREKEKLDGNVSLEGTLDQPDEPTIDLDTISTQSLGLMRTVLVLGFFLTLVGLWSQTHPAVLSFLDSISLYSSQQMVDGVEQAVPITLKSLVAAALICGFSFLIASNLPGLLELVLLQRLELSPGTGFAISTISKYLVYLFGTIATFSALGLAWDQMQWLIAALTVGLGFGLQEIFANFISGLIILFEKPIRIGDTVTIRDLTGTVSKIQIRATTIVDWDRKEIIVPNKAFITEQLVNWSLSDAITRVILKITVAREADPALVDAVLHQAVRECSLALQQPEPEIFFDGFSGHTQNFEVRVYADEMGKRWPLRHDLHMRINSKFKDAGIVMAYPQLDLHINSEVKDTGLIRG